MNIIEKIQDYDEFLKGLNVRIKISQVRAVLSVNRELLHLFWCIGWDILDRQQSLGWGASVIDRLAKDFIRIKRVSHPVS